MSPTESPRCYHESWASLLARETAQPYWEELRQTVQADRRLYDVYPAPDRVLAALQVPLGAVRVVVVGQDPYHGPGQACGLAFSVPPGVAPPPSLCQILDELRLSLGVLPRTVRIRPGSQAEVGPLARVQVLDTPYDAGALRQRTSTEWIERACGDLSPWVGRGVLLLNAALTVRAGDAGSHRGIGWETFTRAVLGEVARQTRPIVWMAWGADARRTVEAAFTSGSAKVRLPSQGEVQTGMPHLILTAPHPSPLAARSGRPFLGCGHFRRANEWLRERGAEPVDWSLGACPA